MIDAADSLQHTMRALEDHAKSNPLNLVSAGRMPAVEVLILPNYAGPDADTFMQPAQPGDAGVDLYATKQILLHPGERVVAYTGLAVAIPEGYEMQIRPKSGLAHKHGLTVLNTPGTIDSGYRGEIGVILVNTNPAVTPDVMDKLFDVFDGAADPAQAHEAYDLAINENTVVIERGQKIAQFVYARYERPNHIRVSHLGESERGAHGFGSTGT